MAELIILQMEPKQLHALITEAVEIGIAAHERRKSEAEKYRGIPPLNRTQVARRLGRSHITVKKLIKEGHLKASSDGMYVTEQAINDYLSQQ